jgi:hypothetical protein
VTTDDILAAIKEVTSQLDSLAASEDHPAYA